MKKTRAGRDAHRAYGNIASRCPRSLYDGRAKVAQAPEPSRAHGSRRRRRRRRSSSGLPSKRAPPTRVPRVLARSRTTRIFRARFARPSRARHSGVFVVRPSVPHTRQLKIRPRAGRPSAQ